MGNSLQMSDALIIVLQRFAHGAMLNHLVKAHNFQSVAAGATAFRAFEVCTRQPREHRVVYTFYGERDM